MSTIPWFRCVRTNASEWFSHSAWLRTSTAPAGTERTTRNQTFAARTARSYAPRVLQRRRYHARRGGASGDGSDAMDSVPSKSLPSGSSHLVAESEAGTGSAGLSRSCVAKAEPRKRLCGMTVAPRMPIAARCAG